MPLYMQSLVPSVGTSKDDGQVLPESLVLVSELVVKGSGGDCAYVACPCVNCVPHITNTLVKAPRPLIKFPRERCDA